MTTLDKELEQSIKEEEKLIMDQTKTYYRTNLYPYENAETGEAFYSLRNYSFDEMQVMNVNGGCTPDAQYAQKWCEDVDVHINAALDAIGNGTEQSKYDLFAMITKELADERGKAILSNVDDLWDTPVAPHVEQALLSIGAGVNEYSLYDLGRILRFSLQDPDEYSIVLEYQDAVKLREVYGKAFRIPNGNVEYLRELIELEIFWWL